MISLDNRRTLLDIRFFYKILNNYIDCPQLPSFNFKVPSCYPRSKIAPLSIPFRRTVFGSNSAIPSWSKILNDYVGLQMYFMILLINFRIIS